MDGNALAAVLRKYPRAVLAMRGAFRDGQLGLMLGAGVSRAFDFNGERPPNWNELIAALEKALDFDPSDQAYQKLSPTLRVEVLFRTFERAKSDPDDPVSRAAALGEWRQLIRRHLYQNAPASKELLSRHPYLSAMLNLILQSPMTVTYNFDSYLEECLSALPIPPTAGFSYQRSFDSISDVTLPQRRSRAVIYHINGYLPRNPLEIASDHLVFSEGEFSSQLMMAMAGRYATVAHHLVNNVYLLIGLSGDDANLRHQLRTNAIVSPGRVHFMVRYVENPREPKGLTEAEQRVADASFDLHNLCELYLTAEEIAALCRLIPLSMEEFAEHARAAGVDAKLVYYISGIPGIGKTTVLRHLGGLIALDEWMEEPHTLLARPHSNLTEAERDSLDRWIADQFKLKNKVLSSFGEGIFIVERGPLDPLAFESAERIAEKAVTYGRRLDIAYHPLQEGQVVVLHGDPKTVERRLAKRQSTSQHSSYLESLQAQLRWLYDIDGALAWHSTDWSIEELVRHFGALVYRDGYTAVDLQARMQQVADSSSG